TMNIQTSWQTKNSPYSLVFGQNPLHYFLLLKEVKGQRINYEDELPDNWFEPSEPQDTFDRQEIEANKIVDREMNMDKEMDKVIDVNKEVDKVIAVDKEIDKVVYVDKEIDEVIYVDKKINEIVNVDKE
ncbi:14247_t:CDS:2, partial [Racocetra persica]